MIKNRKNRTELMFFRDNECRAVEEYLREKASQGWMLREINFGMFFTFKQIEPMYCQFAVDIFNGLEFQEYREYCEASGWNYVCYSNQYMIFITTDKNIVPIQTDEEIVFKKLRKSIMVYIALSIILTLNFVNIIRKGFIMGEVYKIENIFILLLVAILMSFMITEAITNTRWFIKTQSNIKSGYSISHKTLKSLKIKNVYMKLYLYVFLIVILSNVSLHLVNENTYEYSFVAFIMALISGVIVAIKKMIKIKKS